MKKNKFQWVHIRFNEQNLMSRKSLQEIIVRSGAGVSQIIKYPGYTNLPHDAVSQSDLGQIAAYATVVLLNADTPEGGLSDISSYFGNVFEKFPFALAHGDMKLLRPDIETEKVYSQINPLNLRTNAQLNGLIQKSASEAFEITNQDTYQYFIGYFGAQDSGLMHVLGNAMLVNQYGHDPVDYLNLVANIADKVEMGRTMDKDSILEYTAKFVMQNYSWKSKDVRRLNL
jgi:hypothetical protein